MKHRKLTYAKDKIFSKKPTPVWVRLEDIVEYCFLMKPANYWALAREGRVPESKDGKIDLIEATRQIVDYVKARPSGKETLTDLKSQKERLEIKLKEFEVKTKEQEMVFKKDFLQEYATRVNMVRSGLLSLAKSLPPRLIGKTERNMMSVIDEDVRKILEQFARKTGALK
jgi:hypothetical protein